MEACFKFTLDTLLEYFFGLLSMYLAAASCQFLRRLIFEIKRSVYSRTFAKHGSGLIFLRDIFLSEYCICKFVEDIMAFVDLHGFQISFQLPEPTI